jgi:hypothetical protein
MSSENTNAAVEPQEEAFVVKEIQELDHATQAVGGTVGAFDTSTCSLENQQRILAANKRALDAGKAQNTQYVQELCALFGEAAKSDAAVIAYAKNVDNKSVERVELVNKRVDVLISDIDKAVADVYLAMGAKLSTLTVELTEVQMLEIQNALKVEVTNIVTQTINNVTTEIAEFKDFWAVIRDFITTNSNSETLIDLMKKINLAVVENEKLTLRVKTLEENQITAKTNVCEIYAIEAEIFAARAEANTAAQQVMLEKLRLCVLGHFATVEA